MTQEEKARAYDEALKRARALRQEAIDKEYAIDYVKDYEAIFPELAESDDERIRKKIIENVRLSGGYTDEEIDEMISWLEKQKEQKPAEWNTNDKAFIKDCARILDENGYTASAERLLSMFPIKPAECIEDSVEFEEGFKAGRESGLRDGQNYVLNNLDSYGLCKLAEWSEEDELMMKAVIGILDESDHPKLCHWLKSLKPQPKQEWSEEDENARQNLIAHFEGKVLRLSDEAKKEAVDWLKSLRPPFKDREMSKVDYPTTLDEIDQWLFDSFGILPGCCSSMESVKHTTARMVAEALWPKKEDKK